MRIIILLSVLMIGFVSLNAQVDSIESPVQAPATISDLNNTTSEINSSIKTEVSRLDRKLTSLTNEAMTKAAEAEKVAEEMRQKAEVAEEARLRAEETLSKERSVSEKKKIFPQGVILFGAFALVFIAVIYLITRKKGNTQSNSGKKSETLVEMLDQSNIKYHDHKENAPVQQSVKKPKEAKPWETVKYYNEKLGLAEKAKVDCWTLEEMVEDKLKGVEDTKQCAICWALSVERKEKMPAEIKGRNFKGHLAREHKELLVALLGKNE